MNDLTKYQLLRDEGSDASDAYRVLRNDGLNQIEGIRMLRETFLMSLLDAKRLAYEIDTGESSHMIHPGLEKEFTDVLDDLFGEEPKP
jgi:hypothetical protein